MQYFSGFDRSKHSISDRISKNCEITIDGYTFAINTWGNLFYKTYKAMNYLDAKAQCESDGAYLATPRSDDQNAFLSSLIPNENIWIGLNDIDKEGTFVSVDGSDVNYTKWFTGSGQPDNFQHSNGFDEDGVHILGDPNVSNEFWNDGPITDRHQFVCINYIIVDYSG